MTSTTSAGNLLDTVKGILAACRASYRGVRRQTIVYRQQTQIPEHWGFGACRVTVVEDAAHFEQDVSLDYGDYVYEDVVLDFDAALTWFQELFVHGTWKPAGKAVEIANSLRFTHTYETDRPWHPVKYPCHWFRTRIGDPVNMSFEPLLGKDLPPYPNVRALVNHRLGQRDENGDGWMTEFNIYLPSDAARIERVSTRGRRVDVQLRLPSQTGTYTIEVWARNRKGHFFGKKSVNAVKEAVRLEAAPSAAVVFLLDKDHLLIDKKEVQVKGKGASVSKSPAEWQVRILDGESQELEFKNYANAKTGPFKSQESLFDKDDIARQMVAFANTNSGDILIGVEDDGTIRGVENVRGTREEIANIAHGKCEPPLTPKIFTVKFKQGTVVGVHVEVGNKIHMANNIPYIRRNSTTRKARSAELDLIRDRRSNGIPNALQGVFTWLGDDPSHRGV